MRIVALAEGITPEKYFTGKVNLAKVLQGSAGDQVDLYRVKFQAAARTDWHVHHGVQVLYVESGRCRVQTLGKPVEEVGAGDVVVFDAGEKHWHGASDQGEMVHVAMGLFDSTDWFEPVTDAQYQGDTD